jgi:hypothetical protein
MAQIRVDCIGEAYRKSKNAWLEVVYRSFIGSLRFLRSLEHFARCAEP